MASDDLKWEREQQNPVVGTREVLYVLDGLAGLRVIGADVVEVVPIYDDRGETTVLAAAEIGFHQ
jgi:arginase family enzyme